MRYLGTFLLFFAISAPAQIVSIVSGQGQLIAQNHGSFDDLVVQVKTSGGLPMPGATVNWRATGGHEGRFLPDDYNSTSIATTADANGTARVHFYQNPFQGFGENWVQTTVTASVGSATATFWETTSFVDFSSAVSKVNALLLTPVHRYQGVAGGRSTDPVTISLDVPHVALQITKIEPPDGPQVSCFSDPQQPAGLILTDATGIGNCYPVFSGPSGQGIFYIYIGGNFAYLPGSGMPFTVSDTANQFCNYSVSPTGGSVPAIGGTLQTNITASPSSCGWSADRIPFWVTMPSGGSGSGPINIVVAGNTGPARSATILIQGQSYVVQQAGTGQSCTYSLVSNSLTIPTAGGQGSFQISTSPGCQWTITSSVPWISFPNGNTATGSAQLPFLVAPNSGAVRVGFLDAQGQRLTVSQTGSVISGTPSTVSLTPFSGSGTSPTFTAVVSHPSGPNAISTVSLLITSVPYAPMGCNITYNRASNTLQLAADDGSDGSATIAPGSTGTLSNSQCTVFGTGSSVSSTGTILSLNIRVAFQPEYKGKKILYLRAQDALGNADEWLPYGAWWPDGTIGKPVNRYHLHSASTHADYFTMNPAENEFFGARAYVQDGVSSQIYDAPVPGLFGSIVTIPYYRVYVIQTQTHFWTPDRNEYLSLIHNRAAYIGEGIDGYLVSSANNTATLPVYRIVAKSGTPAQHRWTTDPNELSAMLATGSWANEGIDGYVPPAAGGRPSESIESVSTYAAPEVRVIDNQTLEVTGIPRGAGRHPEVRINGIPAKVVSVQRKGTHTRLRIELPEGLAPGANAVSVRLGAHTTKPGAVIEVQ